MKASQFYSWLNSSPRRCLVMGVLNVTPDSFSDGGRFADPQRATAHALQMIEEGADLIDIGGESTRPGSQRIDASEQLRRVVPVIESIRKQSAGVLSIDTTQSAVASAALDAGAHLVNDISAGRDDEEMFATVARRNAPIILMHMQGQPATMQVAPRYHEVVGDVIAELAERIDMAMSAGIGRGLLLVDPGIGFGKGMDHNLRLIRDLKRLDALALPIVAGVSRKSFIGKISGEPEPSHRLFGTAASVGWCVANGASVVRVHDVAPMKAVVAMTEALINASLPH